MAEHSFIVKITPAELRQEIRSLLLEMVKLSDAPARSLQPSVSKSKSEDHAPRGSFGRIEDRSMWEAYCFRFEKAVGDEPELRRLVLRGTRELEWHLKGIPTDRLTLQKERDEQRDIAVLLQYGKGKPAAVIAEMHSWPIGWVRVMRERAGLDPETGWERPKWRQTPEAERYELCERLCNEGLTQQEAGERLGIAQSTVSPYWPKGKLAAA